MRFSVYDKKAGDKIKKKVIRAINSGMPVTVADVKSFCGGLAISSDDYHFGWEKDAYLLRKIRVRETKRGWFLYLPDPKYFPDLNVEPIDELENEEKSPDDIFLDKLYETCVDVMTMSSVINSGRRKCMVWRKSKKKGVLVEEYPCWCTDRMVNPIIKDGVHIANDYLYICEFQDGHVERIRYDHIRFVEEWD